MTRIEKLNVVPAPQAVERQGFGRQRLFDDVMQWRLVEMTIRIASLALVCFAGDPLLHAAEPVQREWTIDGVQREALVYVPSDAASNPKPVVFVFHGHGGSMRNALRTFQYNKHWPESISVYMQGLNTPGQLTDPEGKKPGWQKSAGDQGDRDLKFFDEVLKSVKAENKVDESRIYSTGHSNGGGFTYLLWAERGDVFAATAPSGSAALRFQNKLRPKPMFHVAGENDPLVKFTWQKTMIDVVVKLNGCSEGKQQDKYTTLYESKSGNPVVTYITRQGHKFPSESVPLAVTFFKQHRSDSAKETQ